jgi:3-dehydroquinate dehydratase/shikimate dehydrogenase
MHGLCITIAAPTMDALRARRDAWPDGTFTELRLDAVDRPDVAGALEGRRGPVLVTCRPRRQGGWFDGAEADRLALLQQAMALGAEAVDVEFDAGAPDWCSPADRPRLVISHHDFEGMPTDGAALARAMAATGAGTIKLAVTPSRLTDLLALREIGRSFDGRAVVLGMGDVGIVSRVLFQRMHSRWTYASDDRGVAPGQLSARTMLKRFRVAQISGATEVYGVVGRPVRHSLSPAMHNAAFAALGRDAVYLPIAAATFDDFLAVTDAFGICGASVTAPFKGDAWQACTAHDAWAMATQAVNTLVQGPQGTWHGKNTDVEGFLQPLAAQLSLNGCRAVVVGTGGAARAVVAALHQAGAHVAVHARREEAARQLADSVGGVVATDLSGASWDLLVNATPVGTSPAVEASPVPRRALAGVGLVYDLVYNPADTRLLRDARAEGCRTLGGLDMLVAQAEAQCRAWTGTPPPHGVMRAAAEAALAEGNPS